MKLGLQRKVFFWRLLQLRQPPTQLQFRPNPPKMRLPRSFVPSLLLLAAGAAQAASSWSFDDASLTVTSKKNPEGGVKEKYAGQPLPLQPLAS